MRKQVYELTQQDFDQYPVWEFALDEETEEGQDEATVRPFQNKPPLNPSDGMFVVAASFALADGTKMNGYLTPGVQGDTSLGTIQPIILADSGQVMFWQGIRAPSSADLAESYAALGKTVDQVFPLKFASDVPLVGGRVEGTLDGFLCIANQKRLLRGTRRVIKSVK